MNSNTPQVYWRYGLVLGLVGVAYAALLALAVVLTPSPTYAVSPCGGDGERGCCGGELIGGFGGTACEPGLIQINGCSGVLPDCDCGPGEDQITDSSGVCRAKTHCGGAGERACCLAEGLPACNGDHTEIAGTCSRADLECLCSESTGIPIYSNGRCVPLTNCGNLGQRACCVSERIPACSGDLERVRGCVGDCTCLGGGQSEHMCTNPDDAAFTSIPEPTTNRTQVQSPECALAGYADLHAHLFADLGHGGGVLTGQPYDPVFGINEALRPDFGTKLDLVKKDGSELPTDNSVACPDYLEDNGLCGDRLFHGLHDFLTPPLDIGIDDTVGHGTQDRPTSNLGAPLFNGWPTWTSTTHQQMYHKWLERAYQGGLRLMVMLAVTNEALCLSNKHLRGTDCADSMKAIDAQLDEAHAFEQFIDTQNDGTVNGNGWFRIVTSPQQAREVISEGKLAVVLGIEVDNLFNCKEQNTRNPSALCPNMGAKLGKDGHPYPTIDTIAKAVDYYYDVKDVRHIFPIHNFDNAYGAAATWQDAIAVGNAASEQRWWVVEDCGPSEGDYGFWIDNALFALMGWIGFGLGNLPPVVEYTDDPACNQYGLNIAADSAGPDKRALGVTLIKALMDKGMIIDVDHVSRKSLTDILALTQAPSTSSRPSPYPLVATHVQSFDLHPRTFESNLGRHERMRTKAQLEDIKDDGGMIAAMLKDDVQDTTKKGKKFTNAYGSAIADDCRHSSKTFAQAYQYAVDTMEGSVALGSDFNGVAGHVGPRFGHQACGGDTGERLEQLQADNELEYPFELPGFGTFNAQVTGQRTFDYNTNGLATVGQLPDLVADLKNVGLPARYLNALFRSAEEYIKVWERVEGTFVDTPQAKCSASGVEVAADSTCHAVASIADGSLQGNSAVALSQEPPGPYSLGGTLVKLTVTPTLSCDASTSCQTIVAVADKTPPPLTCPLIPPVECAGPTTTVNFPDATLSPDNCGTAIFGGCSVASGSGFGLGSTPVTCTASDTAGNQGSCDFSVHVQDTTAPIITPNPGLSILECNVDIYSEPGATVADTCDPTVSVQIGGDTVNEAVVDSYNVVYAALDASGNPAAQQTRTVNVQDTNFPNIVCPADIAVEPVSPEGTSVPFEATATDICDAAPVVACPDTGKTFGVGTTTKVICTATDASANQNSCSLLVQVFSEEEVVMNLTEEVDLLSETGSLNKGQANSLNANLTNILRSIENGQDNAACGQLQGFIDKIEEWRDDGVLTEDESQHLIDSATNLRRTLACA